VSARLLRLSSTAPTLVLPITIAYSIPEPSSSPTVLVPIDTNSQANYSGGTVTKRFSVPLFDAYQDSFESQCAYRSRLSPPSPCTVYCLTCTFRESASDPHTSSLSDREGKPRIHKAEHSLILLLLTISYVKTGDIRPGLPASIVQMGSGPGLSLDSSGLSSSTAGETLATSGGSETLESYSASNDSASTSSLNGVGLGPEFAKPRKSTSYFITAMPSSSIPYCSPAASIEELYPFESSRLLPRISADSRLEPADDGTRRQCSNCSTEGVTHIRYRHFARQHNFVSWLAPVVAPCLFSSASLKKCTIVEHECTSCGASFTAQGRAFELRKKEGTEERDRNVAGHQNRPETEHSKSQEHKLNTNPSSLVDASTEGALEVSCLLEDTPSQEPSFQVSQTPTVTR
jgi:hypothetical protein